MITHVLPNYQDVAYLRGDRNYTLFHLKDGRKLIFPNTLRLYESHHCLAYFLRVHKSYLLNPAYILTIEQVGNKITIQMQDGVLVQVSRKKTRLIRAWIKQWK